MNVNPQNIIYRYGYRLNIRTCNCIYFCSHFYEVFKKERTVLQNAIVVNRHLSKEVLAYFKQCEINFICKYFNLHCSSDEYFFEVRKILIQYFPIKSSKDYYLTVIYESIMRISPSNISLEMPVSILQKIYVGGTNCLYFCLHRYEKFLACSILFHLFIYEENNEIYCC